MAALISLVAVVVLILIPLAGVTGAGLYVVFGNVIPYLTILVFFGGLFYRLYIWAKSPVPFAIPTTCGQQKSMDWVKQNKLDNPYTKLGTIGRMALEILTFRSLFRNTKADLVEGKLVYGSSKFLWAAAIVFHYSFLVTFIRHFRFFAEPVPQWIHLMEAIDGFWQIGVPIVMMSGIGLLAGVSYLFIRRIFIPQIRYISLAADYFPLFLIMAIAATGILTRYFTKVDLVAVKSMTMGWLGFSPVGSDVMSEIGVMFWIHLFLICVLFMYLPFSKIMHFAGVFLSPTRNLPNNTRAVRHINPWNPEVDVHTYEHWEEEFKEKLQSVDIPLDKE